MEKIEEFFKNRVSFEKEDYGIKVFYSKQFYTPEEYSLGFLKEKIKPFCYYMWKKKYFIILVLKYIWKIRRKKVIIFFHFVLMIQAMFWVNLNMNIMR